MTLTTKIVTNLFQAISFEPYFVIIRKWYTTEANHFFDMYERETSKKKYFRDMSC